MGEKKPVSFPSLNWKEIDALAPEWSRALVGRAMDRIAVPHRPELSQGFLKGEWVVRLTGGDHFMMSCRAQAPYFYTENGKGPRATTTGTRSGFDLEVQKRLAGRVIAAVEALPRERGLRIRFRKEGLSLVLLLHPARPNALLVQEVEGEERVLQSFRTGPSKGDSFEIPSNAAAPDNLPIRQELLESFPKRVRLAIRESALQSRKTRIRAEISKRTKSLKRAHQQSAGALLSTKNEPDWKRWGDLFQGVLYTRPTIVGGHYLVKDFETDAEIKIPANPRLSPSAQLQDYYRRAKRGRRKKEDLESRIENQKSLLTRLVDHLTTLEDAEKFSALESLERELGLELTPQKKLKRKLWSGRSYLSAEGFPIWIGRNKKENLELTVKHARGNDLWLHLRGRASAHVVIPIPPGKSASLETILDAAQILVFQSGGRDWGKTEVDYTFRKHVKRIPKSEEVSYSQNKTLIVAPDETRMEKIKKRSGGGE